MGLVDAHTHLDFEEFDRDREGVVARAREAGVESWVLCGSIHERWGHTEQIARETGGIAILGVHPWFAAELDESALAPWMEELGKRSLSAVGEIGLDMLYARTDQAHDNQRHALRVQLALARERDVPVVLHCVRAYPELLALLERDGVPRAGGMMHAWSGHPDQVARALRLGLHVSFGPLVMRDRARKARESAPLVPDERLLVETDCPNGMPPGETRGEPAHLVAVIQTLAELRSQSPDHVGRITSANARRLLPIPAREA